MTAWTEAEEEKLRKLIAEGLTSGQAARRLGRSRNSTIGRASRLGINFGGADLSPVAAARHEERLRIFRVAGGRALQQKLTESGHRPVKRRTKIDPASMVEPEPIGPLNDFPDDSATTPKTCRKIHGDPQNGNWRCCGQPVVAGSPYCPKHRAEHFTRDAGSQKGWISVRGQAARMFE